MTGDYEVIAVAETNPLTAPLREEIVGELEAAYGVGADFLGAKNGLVLAALDSADRDGDSAPRDGISAHRDGGSLAGFGVFHDLKDGSRHVGTGLDLEEARHHLGDERIGVFRIALLHSCRGPASLARIASEILTASEDILSERFESHALLIGLLEQANEKAFPLYEKLGFKPRGLVSHLLEIDLARFFALASSAASTPALPAGLEIVFFDELEEWPRESLAQCYARVFLQGAGDTADFAVAASTSGSLPRIDTAGALVDQVVDSPAFAPTLSLLVRPTGSRRVVGFLLAERAPSQPRANITVVGLDQKHRRQSIPLACFPLFARKCVERGVRTATQMTSRQNVVRLVRNRLGGKESDRLIWLIRAHRRAVETTE